MTQDYRGSTGKRSPTEKDIITLAVVRLKHEMIRVKAQIAWVMRHLPEDEKDRKP